MEKLKYDNYSEMGTLLVQWYGAELNEAGLGSNYDLIIPVPLHFGKLTKRGYNQVIILPKDSQVPLTFLEWFCFKTEAKSENQTKKSRMERFKNVSEIFQLKSKEAVLNKRIILVDDVITTGATLFASAEPIVRGGAGAISLATLAVAQ